MERTPYLQSGSYDFWSCYRAAIEKLFEEDAKVIGNHPHLSEEQRAAGLSQLQKTCTALKDVFDPLAFENMRAQGHWRLSYRAFHAALFIQSYRDHLALQMPHRLLNSLMDMDERLTTWRMRHAQMAMRMLGSKMGTGGSSGHQYLASAAAQHRVFDELMRLSTYYIPRSALPEIPDELRRQLSLAGS